jgi:GrpB-like predicted nucleotidyltransferase (UPF0157 family)
MSKAPSSEDYLKAVTIGEPKKLTGKIELRDYDPEWPRLYAREEKRVRAALGERALRVEHAGSTSVPGLCAKPIIDMVLVVVDAADEASYARALEAHGFVLRIREPDWFEHRMFKGPDTDINLHVFSQGCTEVDRMMIFRDWLRTHAGDRDRYANAKRELAQKDWAFTQNYADAKTQVVEEIMARAMAKGRV